MRKITLLVFALAIVTRLPAQVTSCAGYNTLATNAPGWDPSGVQGHLTGSHYWLTNSAGTCTYSSIGQPLCASICSAYGSAYSFEKGSLTNPVLEHLVNDAVNSGTSASNGAAISCAATTAVAAVSCLIGTSCSVSITFSGSPSGVGVSVNFPPSTVMATSSAFSNLCIAENDPSYGCTGNPGFICYNQNGGTGSAPTCQDGSYTCGNGEGECELADTPEDCTEGEEPTCESDGGWSCEPIPGTPIIIDTDGTGFHLTSAAQGVRFDIKGDGKPIQVAWTALGSQNAWLALPDSNGQVTSGKQLFGNVTPQPPSLNPNGFLALAVYDQPDHGGNGDGVIDSRDAIWPQLRLWIDSNHDGIAQPGELHTLSSLGVTSLSLIYKLSKFTDRYGNQFRYKAMVNPWGDPPGDPVNRLMYDVFLSTAGSGGAQVMGGKSSPQHKNLSAKLLKKLSAD